MRLGKEIIREKYHRIALNLAVFSGNQFWTDRECTALKLPLRVYQRHMADTCANGAAIESVSHPNSLLARELTYYSWKLREESQGPPAEEDLRRN